jgi:hypothetical protein
VGQADEQTRAAIESCRVTRYRISPEAGIAALKIPVGGLRIVDGIPHRVETRIFGQGWSAFAVDKNSSLIGPTTPPLAQFAIKSSAPSGDSARGATSGTSPPHERLNRDFRIFQEFPKCCLTNRQAAGTKVHIPKIGRIE